MRFGLKSRVPAFSKAAVAAALLASSFATYTPDAVASGLFSGLAGTWRGDGSIGWSTGETERIRCNATYEVERDGNKLIQNLNCATDTTKLTVKSDINFNPAAGAITGTWTETNYGINGSVSGRANASTINAMVQSLDKRFTARVTVVTRGTNQTVTIAPEGIEVTQVSVNLKRTS
jgi:hypothetical protein